MDSVPSERCRTVSPDDVTRSHKLSKTTQWRERKAGRMPPLVEISPGKKVYLLSQIEEWERRRLAEAEERAFTLHEPRRRGRPRKNSE